MNPRTTLRAYLGWCPGFESASRFLPDREVTNKRIVLSAAVIIIAAMSTYVATEALLKATGYPSSFTLETQYLNPVISEKDGHLYLAVTQISTSTANPPETPAISYVRLYFSELLANGTLRDTVTIAELKDKGKWGSSDFLYSKNGSWILVYNLPGASFDSWSSTLQIVTSSDGKMWGTPTEVYVGDIDSLQPTLLERRDGALFLEFSVFNMTYGTPQEGSYWLYSIKDDGAWSTPIRFPSSRGLETGQFQDESVFVDRDGGVGAVWHESVYSPLDFGVKYSNLVNGSWSEPKPLTSDNIQIRGQEPKILYSTNRGGYYLFVKDFQTSDLGSFPVVHVLFSSDWVHWETRGSFKAQGYTVTELTNGDLGVVYQDVDNYNLYYTSSVDGATWGTPHMVEVVKSAEALSVASLNQRDLASYVVTILVSIAVLVALIRLPRTYIFSKLKPEPTI